MTHAGQIIAEFSSNAVPRQRDGLQCHELNDEALLYDFAHHALHYLNTTAYRIWRGCDGSTTVEELTNNIVADYSIENSDAPKLIADTQQALRNLVHNGLVDCAGI